MDEPSSHSIECPHCRESFDVSPVAGVPDEQVVFLQLESGTGHFDAVTIGKQILNMEKLLRCVASDLGTKVVVFMHSIEFSPDKIKMGFQVVNAPTRKKMP